MTDREKIQGAITRRKATLLYLTHRWAHAKKVDNGEANYLEEQLLRISESLDKCYAHLTERDMKLHVTNYIKARQFEPSEPTLAIRIFDPYPNNKDTQENSLRDSPLFIAVLGCTFDDHNPDEAEYSQEVRERLRKTSITPAIAKQLVTEFEKYYRQAKCLLIHCNAGLSRSPAVALALQSIFNLEFEWGDSRTSGLMRNSEDGDWVGNKYVYKLLTEAANA